jgi:hypothetical protein
MYSTIRWSWRGSLILLIALAALTQVGCGYLIAGAAGGAAGAAVANEVEEDDEDE